MMMVNGKMRAATGGTRSAAVKKAWVTRKRGGAGAARKLANVAGLRDRANFSRTRVGALAKARAFKF